jgi:hypothetical protein
MRTPIMRILTLLLFAFAVAACSENARDTTGEADPEAIAPPPLSTLAAPLTEGCDPAYSPCVPRDVDVDCAGGKGNGPSYVAGPVEVIGADPYGLDEDDDGTGCE